MYTIGQVAEMFGLPVSTLRYYDKQGLFPGLERASGIRRFGDTELEALRVIECLKKAGMEIKDIRLFMEWCAEGPSTYPKRKAMFEERKAHMESEIANMNRALDMLRFKCWYYEQAIQDGSEDRLKALIPDDLPEEIKRPTKTRMLDKAVRYPWDSSKELFPGRTKKSLRTRGSGGRHSRYFAGGFALRRCRNSIRRYSAVPKREPRSQLPLFLLFHARMLKCHSS